MGTQLLEVHPKELKFAFELKKQSSCSVRLTNKTMFNVAFKVKTTSPKKYCVRPNVGIVLANSTCDFTVTMQAQKVPPSDLVCKDKFLVQSTIVPAGTTEDGINSSIFSKEAGALIEEMKLRVSLSYSPIISSNERVLEQGCAKENVACEDSEAIKAPIERFSEKLSGEQEPVPCVAQKCSEVIDMDLKRGKKTNRREWDRSNDIKFSVMKLSPEKAAEECEFDPSTEAYASVKDVISTCETARQNVTVHSPLKDKICYLQTAAITPTDVRTEKVVSSIVSSPSKEGIFSPVKDTSANVRSYTPNIVDSDLCKISEITKHENFVTDCEEEEEMTAAFVVVKEKPKSATERKFALDFEMMKTKLHSLESKLNQAEVIISKLTEERRMSTQERSVLQEELEMLKKARLKKLQSGFPLLFLVMVAIMSAMFGRIYRC